MSSASLALAVGADTWAERARLDGVLQAAANATEGHDGQDLADAARTAFRSEANVEALARELRSIGAILDRRPAPPELVAVDPDRDGRREWAGGRWDEAKAGPQDQAVCLLSTPPPSAPAAGGPKGDTEQPLPPERTPPPMPGISAPLQLPGVPEGLEPGAGGLLKRTLAANPKATASKLKVALAQAEGVFPEDRELLVAGRPVLGNALLHDLLGGQDPDEVEVALVPAIPQGEAPLTAAPAPAGPPTEAEVQPGGVSPEEERRDDTVEGDTEDTGQCTAETPAEPAHAGTQAERAGLRASEEAGRVTSAEALAEERAAREERLDALDRADEWRCAQLEDWAARLMHGVDHLEQRRGQVAQERLRRFENLEKSVNELFERIKPALGSPRA